jgi:hypothetical protein
VSLLVGGGGGGGVKKRATDWSLHHIIVEGVLAVAAWGEVDDSGD